MTRKEEREWNVNLREREIEGNSRMEKTRRHYNRTNKKRGTN